jgi:hypothetical protein
MSGPSADSPDQPPRRELARLGAPFLGLVVIEFLLGMALNLSVSLPTGTPVSILEASPLLDVHVVIGIFLLGIAANALRLSVGARESRATFITSLGLLSGVGAFGAGLDFAFGSPSATASYAMSVGFVGLLLEAGYLLSLRPSASASQTPRSPAPSEA